MIGGGRHQQSHAERHQQERRQVHDLLGGREQLEALVEHGNELEAQHGLHARQHHARLVGGVGCFLFQRLAMNLLLCALHGAA